MLRKNKTLWCQDKTLRELLLRWRRQLELVESNLYEFCFGDRNLPDFSKYLLRLPENSRQTYVFVSLVLSLCSIYFSLTKLPRRVALLWRLTYLFLHQARRRRHLQATTTSSGKHYTTGLSKKMDGIWNRYNLKSTGRIYTFGILKYSEKFKVLDLL